jgi:hypothetical protein
MTEQENSNDTDLVNAALDFGLGMAGDTFPGGAAIIEFIKTKGLTRKFLDWVRRKEDINILVLGASGTGKTSLRKFLFGEDAKTLRVDRTTDFSTYSGVLRGLGVKLIDSPGEDALDDERRDYFVKLKTEGKKLGIINLVSYGIHEGESFPVKGDMIQDNTYNLDYLQYRRDREIQYLKQWRDILLKDGEARNKWVITLISKADLWYGSKELNVNEYYQKGNYAEELKQVPKLLHRTLKSSSLNQMYYGIVPMTGYYTDDMRKADTLLLVESIIELSSRLY